jgi:hypothetical protein
MTKDSPSPEVTKDSPSPEVAKDPEVPKDLPGPTKDPLSRTKELPTDDAAARDHR